MITTFGRVVARKGVKQRFPELVEKEYFLVDVDFIGPLLDQSGKEFSQIFLGRDFNPNSAVAGSEVESWSSEGVRL